VLYHFFNQCCSLVECGYLTVIWLASGYGRGTATIAVNGDENIFWFMEMVLVKE
jgi:hypothetical protein